MTLERADVRRAPPEGRPARPLDPALALRRIERAVERFPKAALFELKERGHGSPFEQLVACIVSIRTRDEVTLPVSLSLFALARTPGQVLELGAERLDELISASTFHEAKAEQIVAIARRVVDEMGGELPARRDVLLSFKGVGPKCANLVMGVAAGEPFIGVDVHVHRVVNRWGYVEARTPEKTLASLEEKLPRSLWIDLNRLLVPFGKHICTGARPACSRCPVADMCRRVGVTESR